MPLKLWDLAAAEDDRRFSPYCWRVKLALAHKGLRAQTVPWRFTEKDAIAFSGQDKVPVLQDDGREVHDSWAIANYLEDKYPVKPLFGSAQARSLGYVFKVWTESVIHPPVLRAVLLDLFAALHEKDQPYFRESREKRFGKTLEEVGADPKKAVADLRGALLPARQQLVLEPYLCGKEPGFADYTLFGAFQWARAVSPQRLLEPDDPVFAWRERVMDLYDGLARNAKGYAVWA